MFWLGKSTTTPGKEEIKLSPIELIILAKLRSRDLRNNDRVGQYGYELINELNTLFAGSWEAKSGTVYPILSKLELNKGLLESVRKKSPLGPVKKVYHLTEEGEKYIDLIIKENFASDVEFILNYLNLLSPFLTTIGENNPALAEEIFEKLMQIPAKGAVIAMEKPVTEIDEELRTKKLNKLKENLGLIISNIEKELNSS